MAKASLKKSPGTSVDLKSSKNQIEELNLLLSDLHLFYMNSRGFHWNIKGEKFFELHLKFEEYFTDALIKIDEVAERILTLGGVPVHSFSQILEKTQIKEFKNVSDGKVALHYVFDGFNQLLSVEKKILIKSSETGDEGTNALMSDYIQYHEKQAWMIKAYLG